MSKFVIEAAKAAMRDQERREQRRKLMRENRRERLWADYELATTLCLNCYGLGHRRRQCTSQGIIACSHCFTVNRFTNSCDCRQENNNSLNPPGQVFRLAGKPEKPLFYADVQVLFKRFEAQISTGQTECTINHHLAKWIAEISEIDIGGKEYLEVPITYRKSTLEINCKIVRYQEHEIILGTEYLMKKKFTFTFDGININQNSIVVPHQRQLQRVYNLQPQGIELRRFVRHHGGELLPAENYEIPDWPPISRREPTMDVESQEEYIRLDVDTDVEDLAKL